MTRKGRPRNSLAKPREPRQRKDPGVEKLVRLRNWLAGQGDPAKSTCPIDVLYAQQVINDIQLQAARRYASDHWRVFGQPSVSAAAYEFRDRSTGKDSEENEEDKEKDQEVWDRLDKLQRSFGRRVIGRRYATSNLLASLRDLIVFETTPRWMTANPPGGQETRESMIFMKALIHLTKN